MRPLKVGVELPIAQGKGGRQDPTWAELKHTAARVEDLGYDSIWIEDHLLFRYQGQDDNGVWDCWSMLSALAAVTERVEIGPLVSCTSFRNPALLAKIADTVDEISGGRLILGLGAGWHEAEYQAFGFPFDHRVSRFAEALTIISGLLKHGEIDFEGTYYSARNCVLGPRGPRPQGPPILLGTIGDRMLKLTAEHADYWNGYFTHTRNTPDGIAPLRERVDAACVAAGRDPGTLGRTAGVFVRFEEAGGATLAPHWDQFPALRGTPEEMAAELRRYADQGIQHIQLWLEPNTLDSIERFAPVLELLDAGA